MSRGTINYKPLFEKEFNKYAQGGFFAIIRPLRKRKIDIAAAKGGPGKFFSMECL